MFNLIITIIAIALVVVLTATSVYYGGSAFSEGTEDAIAATYINQAQQVQAAVTLYKAQEGGVPVEDAGGSRAATLLADGYMSSNPVAPAGGSWEVHGDTADETPQNVVFVTASIAAKNDGGITKEVCDKINQKGSGLVTCVGDGTDPSTPAVGDTATISMAF